MKADAIDNATTIATGTHIAIAAISLSACKQYSIIQEAKYSQLDLPDNTFVLDPGLDFATAIEVVELVHPV